MDRPYVATPDPSTHTFAVEGTLDELSTPQFRDELFAFVDAEVVSAGADPAAETAGVTVSVELSEVEYLLSVAIAALAAAKRHGDDVGIQVSFVAAAGSIAARILEICGLPYEASAGPRVRTGQQGAEDAASEAQP